jgi:hypothetical protein
MHRHLEMADVDTSQGPNGWVPSSPADKMMSPVTRQLNSRKFSGGSGEKGGYSGDKGPGVLDLAADVGPLPCPSGDIELVLGSSSGNRKQVFDRLEWRFSQMAADIDGRLMAECACNWSIIPLSACSLSALFLLSVCLLSVCLLSVLSAVCLSAL